MTTADDEHLPFRREGNRRPEGEPLESPWVTAGSVLLPGIGLMALLVVLIVHMASR